MVTPRTWTADATLAAVELSAVAEAAAGAHRQKASARKLYAFGWALAWVAGLLVAAQKDGCRTLCDALVRVCGFFGAPVRRARAAHDTAALGPLDHGLGGLAAETQEGLRRHVGLGGRLGPAGSASRADPTDSGSRAGAVERGENLCVLEGDTRLCERRRLLDWARGALPALYWAEAAVGPEKTPAGPWLRPEDLRLRITTVRADYGALCAVAGPRGCRCCRPGARRSGAVRPYEAEVIARPHRFAVARLAGRAKESLLLVLESGELSARADDLAFAAASPEEALQHPQDLVAQARREPPWILLGHGVRPGCEQAIAAANTEPTLWRAAPPLAVAGERLRRAAEP